MVPEKILCQFAIYSCRSLSDCPSSRPIKIQQMVMSILGLTEERGSEDEVVAEEEVDVEATALDHPDRRPQKTTDGTSGAGEAEEAGAEEEDVGEDPRLHQVPTLVG